MERDWKDIRKSIASDPSSGFIIKHNSYTWYVCFKTMRVHSPGFDLDHDVNPFFINKDNKLENDIRGLFAKHIQKGYREYLDKELTRAVEEIVLNGRG